MKHSGPLHPRLDFEQPMLYLPDTGASVAGSGLGPAWVMAAGGVVTHPTPAAGFVPSWRRTRITSAAAAANQELGVRQTNANVWRGNALPLGGFYFHSIFRVHAMPNNAIRLFVGVTAATGAGVCIANAVPANTVGLWCDDADNANLTIVTADNGAAATKTPLLSAGGTPTPYTLVPDVLHYFTMIANPANNVIVTQLGNYGTDTLMRTQNVSLTMPLNTAFMAPQIGLSNAANVAGGDVALDVMNVYVRPNLFLVPRG